MSSVNKVILIGRLGVDPSVNKAKNDKSVCSFSLATNEKWTDAQGFSHEKTEWHKIVTWNGLADICAQYLKKGSLIYVEGSLQTNKWKDENGIEKYSVEVIASNIQFLESKS